MSACSQLNQIITDICITTFAELNKGSEMHAALKPRISLLIYIVIKMYTTKIV